MTPDDYAEWESQQQYEGLLIDEARALCGALEALANRITRTAPVDWPRHARVNRMLSHAWTRYERRCGADGEAWND